MTTTNMRNIAIIASDKFVSLKCSFDLELGTGAQYTYIAPREFASSLVAGEHVAARKADGKIVVVHVCSVDEDCDIDLEASWNYQFAFQKINTHELVDLEHNLEESVKELNKHRRDSIRRSVVAQAMKEIGIDTATTTDNT